MLGAGPSSDDDVFQNDDNDVELHFIGQFEDEDNAGILAVSSKQRTSQAGITPTPARPIPIPSTPPTPSIGKQALGRSVDSYMVVPRSANMPISSASQSAQIGDNDTTATSPSMLSMYDYVRRHKQEEEEFCVGSAPGSHDYRRRGREFLAETPKSRAIPAKK